jgi:hypothetical protein
MNMVRFLVFRLLPGFLFLFSALGYPENFLIISEVIDIFQGVYFNTFSEQ